MALCFNIHATTYVTEPARFWNAYIIIIKVFIDAVEQYDSQILKEAFHLNFDDVGKDIEGFWLN